MRASSRRALALLCLSLAAAAPRAAGGGASAQVVEPGRKLFVLSTDRFDLYYPAELGAEADRLASFADATYARLAARFPDGASRGGRIPVLLADGYADLDGSFTPYPSDRITILASPAPLSSELGSFDDELRSVFAHELAHALSMRTRGPLWSIAASLFGDPVEPAALTATRSMTEGAAVASEGRGGSGRARDPLAYALVAQDILEGRFKDFWQATGAWDAYPFGKLPYVYGGLFSSRLIETRGDEAYAELWRRLGRGRLLPGIEGGPLAKGDFEEAYGEGLDEAWEEFRDWATIKEPVVMATRRLAREPGYITALAAGESGLYWSDAAAGAILALDRGAARPRRVRPADGGIERLDLSPDGRRLLVSWSLPGPGGKGEPIALACDAATGEAEGPPVRGLREAAFAGDALVGITGEGFRADLVIERDGGRRVLLAGSPTRSYSSPASLDGKTVYCLAEDAGRILLVRVEVGTGRACALVPSLPIERPRSLSIAPLPSGGSGARLLLSFAEERSLPRLALVDDSGGAEASMARQDTPLSGSVLLPAARGGEICYLGRFSAGEYPCAYPAEIPALALRKAPASWAELDPSFLRPRAEPPSPPMERTEAPALPLIGRSFRYPAASPTGRSAGLGIAGADIAERLSWSAEAQYDWEVRGADLALGLSLGLEPWTLSATLADGFDEAGGGERRATSARLGLSREWRFLPRRRRLALGLDAEAAALAPASRGEAYSASYEGAAAAAGALLRYSAYRAGSFPPFASRGAGAEVSLDAEWPLAPAAEARPGIALEAGADAALPFLGFACSLDAALSPDSSIAFGPGGRATAEGAASIRAPRYGYYREYSSLPAKGSLYAFGEVSISPLSLELQERPVLGALRIPLYLERLVARAGFRGAAYGPRPGFGSAELISSAYGRLSLETAPLFGMASSARISIGAELSWAFRGDLAGRSLSIAFVGGALL